MKIGVGIDGTADERTLWGDDDNRKACVATPPKTLEERIMNPCIEKTDAEWWAKHEIDDLRHQLQRLVGAVEAAFDRPDLLAVETDLRNALSCARMALKLHPPT